MKTFLPLVPVLLVGIAGCTVEVDPNAFFPQDYTTTFAQLGGCRVSSTHSDPYYLYHVTATSKDAITTGMPLPEGTVLIKTQYRDNECTDQAGWTVMKKREAGFDPTFFDWEWQNVDAEGHVAEQGKLSYCKTCHQACADGVCTK